MTYVNTSELVLNGDFETGDTTFWTKGGITSQTVTDEDYKIGKYSLLLGDPDDQSVQIGINWAWQLISIPITATSSTLTLWYRFKSYDDKATSHIKVYIRDSNGNNLERILYDGYTGGSPGYHDLGWKQKIYDATPYIAYFGGIQIYIEVTDGNGNPGSKTCANIDAVSLPITTTEIGDTAPALKQNVGSSVMLVNNII
jgi:hypothetical protein